MPAPAVHQLTILFYKDNKLPVTSSYSGPFKQKIIYVPEGDKMKIAFQCLDAAPQPTILTPILNAIGVPPSQPGAPFQEGLHVDLPATRILTGGPTPGHWEFTVSFAVNWPGGTGPVPYLLPDPELQVGPRTGDGPGL